MVASARGGRGRIVSSGMRDERVRERVAGRRVGRRQRQRDEDPRANRVIKKRTGIEEEGTGRQRSFDGSSAIPTWDFIVYPAALPLKFHATREKRRRGGRRLLLPVTGVGNSPRKFKINPPD